MDYKIYIESLKHEKAGYEAKAAGASDDDAKERYRSRIEQVNAEMQRVAKARSVDAIDKQTTDA